MIEGDSCIILQARMGSTRMPGKVLRPFHKHACILDIILKTVQDNRYGLPVLLATSMESADDALQEWAFANGIGVYRGDENDVLNRFVEAADLFDLKNIVRVCADNPFLDLDLLNQLIGTGIATDHDYISYLAADETPAMKSHLGFFAEWVKADALRKVQEYTTDTLYTEHVTNYVYGHPETFDLFWIKAPAEIYNRRDIRFTIDTPADFELMQRLYSLLAERGITPNFSNALHLADSDEEAKQIMQTQIRNFSK